MLAPTNWRTKFCSGRTCGLRSPEDARLLKSLPHHLDIPGRVAVGRGHRRGHPGPGSLRKSTPSGGASWRANAGRRAGIWACPPSSALGGHGLGRRTRGTRYYVAEESAHGRPARPHAASADILALHIRDVARHITLCGRSLYLPRPAWRSREILWHDGVGLSLYVKRLDRGKFISAFGASGRRGVDLGGADGVRCLRESTGAIRN